MVPLLTVGVASPAQAANAAASPGDGSAAPGVQAVAPGYCAPQSIPLCGYRDSIAFVGSFRRSREWLQLRIRFGGQPCPSCRSGPHYVVAWIDWNTNHEWEESERVYFASPFYGTFTEPSPRSCEGDTVMTPLVRIPSWVTADSTWMRVGMFFDDERLRPCKDPASFYGDGNTTDHRVLLRDAAVVRVDVEGAETRMQDVQDPIWQASLAYGSCDPVAGPSSPFAGGFRGAGPTLRVSLETCTGPMDFTPRVTYRWRVLDAFGAAPDTGRGSFEGWDGRIDLRLPRAVQKTQTELTFDIEDGDKNVLRSGQTITLDTYVGYDVASTVPGGIRRLWLDRGLEWANGGTTPADIAQRLSLGIYAEGAEIYRGPFVPWRSLQSMGGSSSVANCVTLSDLWAASMNMLGIASAEVLPTYGSRSAGFVTRPGAPPSFDPTQTGNVGPEFSTTPDRWLFGMHQVGTLPVAGVARFFDPTFGREYTLFPQDLIVWNMLPGATTYLGRLALRTDDQHFLYEHEPPGAARPWGFYYFTPVPGPFLVANAERDPAASTITAQFVNPGTWTAEDANGDGQFEALRWDGAIEVNGTAGEAADFSAIGILLSDTILVASRESDASMIPTSVPLPDAVPGTYAVALRFSGEEIRRAALDGSFEAQLWLSDSTGAVLDSVLTPTPVIASGAFGEARVRMGAPSDAGLDRDASGYLDGIEVDIPITAVDTAGIRVLAWAVVPSDSTHFTTVDTTLAALPGSQVVRLELPGTDFVLHGVDGPYRIHAEIQEQDVAPRAADFTSQAYLIGDFDPAAVEPSGPAGYATPLDTDGIGLADVLAWDKLVDVARPGVYRTRAVLTDRYYTPIVSAVAVDTLPWGFADIRLRFPGGPIRDHGLDPRYVIGVETFGEDGVRTMHGDYFELNVQVSHLLFDPSLSPYVRLGGGFTSSTMDSNGDGRIDALYLHALATNLHPDSARIVADALLLGPTGRLLTLGTGAAFAPPGGTVPLDLRFDGREIHVAGESGAYSVDQLFAVSERDTLRFYGHGAYVAHAHTTAPFTPSQFAPAPHAFGVVMDGAAVVGAELKMEGPGQVAVTDTSGSFRLGTPALLPGEHTVTLRLPAGHDTTGWRVIVNGQSFGTGRFATLTFDSTDAVRLDFLRGASLDVPQGGAALPLLRVERVAPNPAGTRGPARVRYLLSEPARLRVEVFDALGRRALPPWDRMAPPGWGQVTLERPLARGSRLSPGIYLVRVAAEAAGGDRMVWSGRFVVLE